MYRYKWSNSSNGSKNFGEHQVYDETIIWEHSNKLTHEVAASIWYLSAHWCAIQSLIHPMVEDFFWQFSN
ncbi:hypothetical protein AAZX31_12G030300 [Glycine max]